MCDTVETLRVPFSNRFLFYCTSYYTTNIYTVSLRGVIQGYIELSLTKTYI